MNLLEKTFKHIALVMRHKKIVFRYCKRAGIPLQGLLHDLSKFSPVELFESIKYYNGQTSPINLSRKENGYSEAWLHHKGRNKHHYEYWIDTYNKPLIMPYKYALEMCIDMLAAGKVYMKDSWTKDYPLWYWNLEKDKRNIHPAIMEFQTLFFETLRVEGLNVLDKEKTLKMYEECISKYENKDNQNVLFFEEVLSKKIC